MLFVPAAAEEDKDEDEEDDLLRRTGNFVASSDRLPSGILRVSHFLLIKQSQRGADLMSHSVNFKTPNPGDIMAPPHRCGHVLTCHSGHISAKLPSSLMMSFKTSLFRFCAPEKRRCRRIFIGFLYCTTPDHLTLSHHVMHPDICLLISDEEMSSCQQCPPVRGQTDHRSVPPLRSGRHDGRPRPINLPLPGSDSQSALSDVI